MDYRQAGVDIDAGDTLVKRIKPLAKATHRPGVISGIGGFAAVFDLQAAGFDNPPLLVMSSDGVGTKLKIAIDCDMPYMIGIDLVAMCVNDLVVQGAKPLAFLDYYATGKLDIATASRVIAGIAGGCFWAGCSLVGGETAEMPGMYLGQDYDLAGFAVGAVTRDRLLPANILPGDVLLGLRSSGVHSNGFALVRKIVARTRPESVTMLEHWNSPAPFCRRTLVDAFLEPTELYVKPVLALNERHLLTGAAHITGGGLVGNVSRIMPDGCQAVIDQPWAVPPMFSWLRHKGNVSRENMLRTFNCGIGMVLVLRRDCVAEVREMLDAQQCSSVMLGHVGRGNAHAIQLPEDKWWG